MMDESTPTTPVGRLHAAVGAGRRGCATGSRPPGGPGGAADRGLSGRGGRGGPCGAAGRARGPRAGAAAAARRAAAAQEYLDRFPDMTRWSAPSSGTRARAGRRAAAPTAERHRRNLLFGILALQNNFIGRDDLLAAFAAWVADKARPLAQILVDRGALDESRRALLEALVAEHLKQHGGDTEASLAAVSSLGSVREDLERLGDADLRASLAATTYRAAGREPTRRRRRPTPPRPAAPGGGSASSASTARAAWAGSTSPATRSWAARWRSRRSGPTRSPRRTSRGRFVLEAEINGGLEHPGIVPVYSLGTYDDGRPVLRHAVRRGRQPQGGDCQLPSEARKWKKPEQQIRLRLLQAFVSICRTVGYAHSRGVIHRDLKPANIILGGFGEVIVLDWGLAKMINHPNASEDKPSVCAVEEGWTNATSDGQLLGTLAYMCRSRPWGNGLGRQYS